MEKLIEKVKIEGLKEKIRANMPHFKEIMSKATDTCSAGQTIQSFDTAVSVLKAMMSS